MSSISKSSRLSWLNAARGRRRPLSRAGLVAVLGVASLVIAGCGGGGSEESGDAAPTAVADADAGGDAQWKQTVEAAKGEGSVVLYLSITGVDDRLKKAWKQAYPDISLDIFRTGSAELLSRLDQEKSTGAKGADVTVHADEGWFIDNQARLMAPSGPAYPNLWASSKFTKAEGKYVLVDGAPLGIAYNTNVVEEIGAKPPETYADLLQPQLKGQIGITPAENAGAALQWWYTATEELGGADGIKKVAALQPQPYKSLTPLVEALAAGEHAVAAYASLSVVEGLKAKGAPIDVVVPNPAIGGGHSVASVDWASHRNAAQVFRNWLLSPAGQIALNGPGDLYTPLPMDKIANAPKTMKSIPDDMFVTSGIISVEEKQWMETVWKPAFAK